MAKGSLPKIVSIAGGTGRYSTLKGLKDLAEITALYNITDSGGSSGILRVEHGVLPPGDGMRALAALAKSEEDEKFLLDRFEAGRVNGHRIANLMYEAASRKFGGPLQGIKYLEKLFKIRGHILPVSNKLDIDLVAKLEDGEEIRGEHEIDIRGKGSPIVAERLSDEAEILAEAKEAILAAQVILLGPGDLWTSIIPHLLVKGLPEAVRVSKAQVILICNLFTKPGETDDYKASDFAKVVAKYLGKKIDDFIINTDGLSQDVKAAYQKDNQEIVEADDEESKKYAFRVHSNFSLASEVNSEGQKVVRHDSEKTAQAIASVILSG